MSKIKNYIDALNAVRTLIVTDSVSDNDIEMYANVIYLKIMEHDSPELAASYIIRNLFKEHKAETTRIACNYQVEHSTMMADRYALLIHHIMLKIKNMMIPLDEETIEYVQSLQPHHEELPEDLNTDEAKGYLQRLVDHKFCDINYHWNKDKTKYQATQAAHHISFLLWGSNKWKPFETLWKFNNMAGIYNKMFQANDDSIKEIDGLFPENAPPTITKFK